MSSLYIAFYALMLLWLLSEVFYRQKLASGSGDKKGKDKSTLNMLWLVIILSIIGANTTASLSYLPILANLGIQYIGLLLIFTGIALRVIIIKSLGKYFTVDVTIRENHQIKKDGFYTLIRHPSYAFSLLTFLGLGLFLNNWLSLAIAFTPPFLAFSYRISVEEKTLIEQFGNEYIKYKNTTKKLIPYIY